MFESVVEACLAAGLVGGEGFAIDASLIQVDANKQRSIAGTAATFQKVSVVHSARMGTSASPRPHAFDRPSDLAEMSSRVTTVATTSRIVSAAPSKISPRSVRAKMPTGSVTQPGG